MPQDPNDEPASVLLERIGADRKAIKPEATTPSSDLGAGSRGRCHSAARRRSKSRGFSAAPDPEIDRAPSTRIRASRGIPDGFHGQPAFRDCLHRPETAAPMEGGLAPVGAEALTDRAPQPKRLPASEAGGMGVGHFSHWRPPRLRPPQPHAASGSRGASTGPRRGTA